jgi:hypothetical protein
MAEYTVVAAEHKKAVDGRNGPMQVIALRLSDGTTEHAAEWFTKADTAVPSPNTRIEGTLEPSQYGLKFKKDRPAFGGTARTRDPKESAAIQRQHSQGCAVALLHVKAIAGKLADDDLTPAKIKALADWFDDDIAGGVERKHPSQKTVHGLPVHNEPVPTGAPEPTTPSTDYPEEHPDTPVPWEQSA